MANSKRHQHARRPTGATRPTGPGGAAKPGATARPPTARPQQAKTSPPAQTTATANGAAKPTGASGGTAGARTSAATAAAKTPPRAPLPRASQAAAPLSRGAQRRRQARQPWWVQYKWTLGAGVAVLLIVALFVALARSQADVPGIGKVAPDAVMKAVSQPDAAVWGKVGTGGLNNPFTRAGGNAGNGGDFLKGPNGHPEFFYAGAEYCPYCAGERWSIVMALSRFGTFKNLQLSASSSTDTFPNTNTFSFVGSSYTSSYVDFSAVELQDRDQQPLQTPTADQNNLLTKYNKPPYVQGSAGSIPFLSVANQYMTNGAGYDVSVLGSKSWQDIAGRLSNPNDDVTKKIVGNANYITAAICQVTNQQPGNVCTAAPIPDIEKQLNGK